MYVCHFRPKICQIYLYSTLSQSKTKLLPKAPIPPPGTVKTKTKDQN